MSILGLSRFARYRRGNICFRAAAVLALCRHLREPSDAEIKFTAATNTACYCSSRDLLYLLAAALFCRRSFWFGGLSSLIISSSSRFFFFFFFSFIATIIFGGSLPRLYPRFDPAIYLRYLPTVYPSLRGQRKGGATCGKTRRGG